MLRFYQLKKKIKLTTQHESDLNQPQQIFQQRYVNAKSHHSLDKNDRWRLFIFEYLFCSMFASSSFIATWSYIDSLEWGFLYRPFNTNGVRVVLCTTFEGLCNRQTDCEVVYTEKLLVWLYRNTNLNKGTILN